MVPTGMQGPDFVEAEARDLQHEGFPARRVTRRTFNTWAYDINGDGWDDVIQGKSFPRESRFSGMRTQMARRCLESSMLPWISLENESPQFARTSPVTACRI